MILHLLQPIPYEDEPLASPSLAQAWRALREEAETMEAGAEAALAVDASRRPQRAGRKEAPDDDERERTANGMPGDAKAGDWAIEAGRWHFVQLDAVPAPEEIGPVLEAHTAGPCIIRLLAERAGRPVAQLFWLP